MSERQSKPQRTEVYRTSRPSSENSVLHVHRAAEPLDTIVEIVVDLDEVNFSAVTNALECDTVELVIIGQTGTGILNAKIHERTGVISGIITTEKTGRALTGLFTVCGTACCRRIDAGIDRSETVNDHRRTRCHADRIIRRTVHDKLRAAGNDEVIVSRRTGTGSRRTKETNAGLNSQRRARTTVLANKDRTLNSD